jgi:hypothetical protein
MLLLTMARGRRVVDTGCQLRGRARHRPRLADRRRRNRPDRQCTNIALERDVPEITRPSEAGIAKLLAPTGRRNGTPLEGRRGGLKHLKSLDLSREKLSL